MEKLSLRGPWTMTRLRDSLAFETRIPTTMYQVLYENGVIEDPFVGENDNLYTDLSEDDYRFEYHLRITEETLAHDRIFLTFYGIDTLSRIYLNGYLIAKTQNMHRTYDIEVKKWLALGDNHLVVEIDSPLAYIRSEQAKDPLWGVENPIDGYEHIRKAHHMFGWDWGPRLPDLGIWREVELRLVDKGQLKDVYIGQKHQEDSVSLQVRVEVEMFEALDGEALSLEVLLYDPKGNQISKQGGMASRESEVLLQVTSPELWWPNGYGDQNLYLVEIRLKAGETCVDQVSKKLGLRTLTMTREKDTYGESFDMTVNGVRIFAMGADYIPEDALICRMNRERTESLIQDCVNANFNHLRVWGGAFYPSDDFYDLCDQYGLLVWQDFMFACGVYRLTKQFEDNIREEIQDNIKRIRHHACLALWCGNNEMEVAFVEWGLPKDERLKLDYLLMYEKLIPDLLAELDPTTFYWPASPSSGGGFDNPNGDNKGDVHYWNVFHGGEHYKAYRKHYFRFASEYGMQSFPDMATIKTYAKPEERQIFGPVMENHNKCWGQINGNMKIMMNMAAEFNLPQNLEDIVYISQLFQGYAIKCAVEHFRRNRGRCMGSTYWQLNDNYPVASWSSIDVYGRLKGLHYMVKRFYAPVLLSAYEDKNRAYLNISNERLTPFIGKVRYRLHHVDRGILFEKEKEVTIPALTALAIDQIAIDPYLEEIFDERRLFVTFELWDAMATLISWDTLLFVPHKHFEFKQARIQVETTMNQEMVTLTLKTEDYVKGLALSYEDQIGSFSDNFFDLIPGQSLSLTYRLKDRRQSLDDKAFQRGLTITCVNNLTYIR